MICALLITTENKYGNKDKNIQHLNKITRHLIPIWNQKRKEKQKLFTRIINKIYRFCRRQSYMHIDTKTVHTCFCTLFQCPKAFAMSVILFKQKLNTLTHFTFEKK